MFVQVLNAMCTGKNPPRQWEMDGREGVSYKVEISDGNGNIKIACADEDVYNKFVPFERFNVEIDLQQTNYEGRTGVKAQVSYAEKVEDAAD